ncbi:large ribosomal subunit protein uL30m-like [Glandiceps talaboti]
MATARLSCVAHASAVSLRLSQAVFLKSQPWRSCYYERHHRGRVRARPGPIEVEERYDDTTPHMLHAVRRTNSTRGRPYWEKEMIEELGLTMMHQVNILKNTPATNQKLQMVKHLVKIQPIYLKQGLPKDGDYDNTLLKHNGEFVLTRKLQNPDNINSTSETVKELNDMTTDEQENQKS